eukprot:130186_1
MTVWFPLLDMVTDIITIVSCMKSNNSEIISFGIVLCIIQYLSLRFQAILLMCYCSARCADHGDGDFPSGFDLIDEISLCSAFFLYLPIIGSKELCSSEGVCEIIIWGLITECIAFIYLLIYPFYHLMHSLILTCQICNLICHPNEEEETTIFDKYDQEVIADWAQAYQNTEIYMYRLSMFGWIEFSSQFEALIESSPQLIIQIWIYIAYSQSIPLWIFVLSTTVSGLNVIRVILKLFMNGGLAFTFEIEQGSDDPRPIPDKHESIRIPFKPKIKCNLDCCYLKCCRKYPSSKMDESYEKNLIDEFEWTTINPMRL